MFDTRQMPSLNCC